MRCWTTPNKILAVVLVATIIINNHGFRPQLAEGLVNSSTTTSTSHISAQNKIRFMNVCLLRPLNHQHLLHHEGTVIARSHSRQTSELKMAKPASNSSREDEIRRKVRIRPPLLSFIKFRRKVASQMFVVC